jgi:hypothetical protein
VQPPAIGAGAGRSPPKITWRCARSNAPEWISTLTALGGLSENDQGYRDKHLFGFLPFVG